MRGEGRSSSRPVPVGNTPLDLRGHVGIALERSEDTTLAHRHPARVIEFVVGQLKDRLRERLQRGVVLRRPLQHHGGHGEDHAGRHKAAAREDVVNEQPVDAAVAVTKRMYEDEAVADERGVQHAYQ